MAASVSGNDQTKSPVRGTQPASFRYFQFNEAVHRHEKPYEILINLPIAKENPEKYRRTNQEFHRVDVVVEDIRGQEGGFTLDEHGVCWRDWAGPTAWQRIGGEQVKGMGDEAINKTYISEVEQFIQRQLETDDGAKVDLVKVFDYRLRLSQDEAIFSQRTVNLKDGLDSMIPATQAHVDQSPLGAAQRVQLHMGEKASELLKRRFRIVNVWKPLKPIKSWPLAICDHKTVNEDDLIASDLVRRNFVGETLYCKYHPEHRWFYVSDQQPDEVTMLKIYDSKVGARIKFCMHASFQPPNISVDDVRESFEVRALVFDPPAES